MKGIYALWKRFLVKKYGLHIGVFDTYQEAEQAAIEAEEFNKENK